MNNILRFRMLPLLGVALLALSTLALAQGTYTQFDVPGAFYTYGEGLDTAGDIVGATASTEGYTQGFLLSGGTYTTIDYPGSSDDTYLSGINDEGQIVGFTTSKPQTGFVYDIESRTFTKVAYPGAPDTDPI